MRTSVNEELGTLADNNPLTGYEPNVINNYQISETTEIFIQESCSDSRPSNLHGLEIDDYTIGRALSSPLFTQEREDSASRRQAYHSLDESLLSSQSLSVGHVRTGRPVSDEFGSRISNVRENPRRDSESEQIRILLERQKDQILADYRAEIQTHEFQADYDRRSIQELNEPIESQRGEIYRAHQGDEKHRRDQQLLHEQLLEQNRELREAHEKSLKGIEELKRFHGSTFDTISSRKLIEDQDTILELTAKIQELQKEVNCMNDSKILKMLNQFAVDNPTLPVNLRFSHLSEIVAECLAVLWECRAATMGRQVFGTRMVYRETFFANPQESNPWVSDVSEHTSPHVMSESETAQDQRCQTGPSARNSFVPSVGGFSKNYGADQQRLQISDHHCDKFTTSAMVACWKIRFKTELCTCSKFLSEAMMWIKEVEMVESVDDLKS